MLKREKKAKMRKDFVTVQQIAAAARHAKHATLKKESLAVQPIREIFAFRGNKLSRMRGNFGHFFLFWHCF